MVFLIFFSFYFFVLLKKFTRDNFFIDENQANKFKLSNIIKLLLGFILLSISSEYFINSIITISQRLNFINNIAISMSIVAFGTSVPELMTSLIALIKKEEGLAIGNVLGSNIINILLIMGLSSLVSPFNLNFNLISKHLLILAILTISLILIIYTFRKINRISGYFFISIYFIFLYINFSS